MDNNPLKIIAYFFIIVIVNYLSDDIIKPYIDTYYKKMNDEKDAPKLCKMVFSMNQYSKYYSIMHKNHMNDISTIKDEQTMKNELKKLLYLEKNNKHFILNKIKTDNNDIDNFKNNLKYGFDKMIDNVLKFTSSQLNITVKDVFKNNQIDSKSKLLKYKLDENNTDRIKIEKYYDNNVIGGKKKTMKNILKNKKTNKKKTKKNKK